MMDRLVVHPRHGQAWFYSACALDAILQAAGEWNESSSELLAAYKEGTVRVMVRKTSAGEPPRTGATG